MKTLFPARYLATFALAALLFSPIPARADSYFELAELADNLDDLADDLEDQLEDHFEDSRSYSRMDDYIERIQSRNSRVERRARLRSSSTNGIRQDVDEIDRLTESLHGMVNELERDAGRFLLRRFGNTRKIHSLLASMENIISRMERYANSLGQGVDSNNRYSNSGRVDSPRYGGNSSNRHSYPEGDYRGNRGHGHVEPVEHDDDDGRGGLLQRIHRKHIRVRNAILGID